VKTTTTTTTTVTINLFYKGKGEISGALFVNYIADYLKIF
jgi:hypothetical protein